MNLDINDKERLTTQILDKDKDKDKDKDREKEKDKDKDKDKDKVWRKMSRVVGIGIGHSSGGSSISHSTDAWRRRAES